MSADGYGEREPIANNAKADGRAINRRIEIFLNPG
jgi:flagellar motor protein MotB